MDPTRKKSFAGFIYRSGTSRPFDPTAVSRVATDLSVSSLEISGSGSDTKGAIGLTTLYEPADPEIDFVFIHGLGGGSRKTWAYSTAPEHYWPQAWLPTDDAFRDVVRIHTFGYRADWGSRGQSMLNIHDFGQSLVAALRNHPGIRRSSTRIVLIGHSMGGCVAKKAYILAREDPDCGELAARIHSIFFLGTPHRGSDMAAVLENMLTVAWGKKPFVNDLTPNSATLSGINDAFRHFAASLQLWSFFETLPVKAAGVMNRMVVEKYSATLGYPGERIEGMDADHRHVCKFETEADPNYQALRNALHSAIDMIRGVAQPQSGTLQTIQEAEPPKPPRNPISLAEASALLKSFLGIADTYEGDLAAMQDLRQPGSCQWFVEKECFTSWTEGSGPSLLWLMGKPAAGKSILSSYVIEQLQPLEDVCCSFFIFKYAKVGNSVLSECFRTLAYQMAMQDDLVRDKLLQLEEEGGSWDKTDDPGVWRKLFVSCIFHLPRMSQHFWVIDGIDECANFSWLFSKKLLAAIPDNIRLFATSRPLEEIEIGVKTLGQRAKLQLLSDSDTLEDMRLFLHTRLEELNRLETDKERQAMCDKILAKSSGSFLWTRLVIDEFKDAWTEELMEEALREVPAELDDLYSRMIQSIETDRRKLPVAQSILNWVVLASRPLTADELRCAVKMDVDQTLRDVDRAIPDLCKQLVRFDRETKTVHMIHETAREFLVAEGRNSELAIVHKKGHTRLGLLLLRYLGDALKPQQSKTQAGGVGTRKSFAIQGSAAVAAAQPDLSLLDYAVSFFSEHLFRSTSEDESLMMALCDFLKTNDVLSWIEQVAKSKDLNGITRTAVNLRDYLVRRTKYVPPTDLNVQRVDGWVTDLIRVAAKFRTQLLACPSSIHCLIPPLCPSDSMIARTFVRDPRPPAPPLIVKGLDTETWDDCLIRMDFQKGQTTSVTHGDRFFAVGLSTGQISLYDAKSVQRVLRMQHVGRVKALAFSYEDQYLVSCGGKNLVIWDPKSGAELMTFPLPSAPLGLCFIGADQVLCACQDSHLATFDIAMREAGSFSWLDDDIEPEDDDDYYGTPRVVPDQPPSRVAFLTGSEGMLLAIGYRSHPILLLNGDLQVHGQCDPGYKNGIDDMVFNPNPDICALVVSLGDGTLCVFNYRDGSQDYRRSDVFAHSLACTTDGRSLLVGTSQGNLEVYDFDEADDGAIGLTLIYRTINPPDDSIRGATFSADGLRFVDIRGRQGRVWAPAVLVRKNASELESSVGSSLEPAPLAPTAKAAGMLHGPDEPEITSPLVASVDGAAVVAGKSSGAVVLYSTADGTEKGVLYRHARDAAIVSVALGEARNLIVSADDAGRVIAAELAMPLSRALAQSKLVASKTVVDGRFGGAVVRVLLNANADRILVSGRFFTQLWEIPSGQVIAERGPFGGGDRTAGHSMQNPSSGPVPAGSRSFSDGDLGPLANMPATYAFHHPANQDWFIVVENNVAHIHAWSDFAQLSSDNGIHLNRNASAPGKMLSFPQEATAPLSLIMGSPAANATASYLVASGFVIELFRSSSNASARVNVWPAMAFDPASTRLIVRPATEPNLEAIGPAVLTLLGVAGTSTLLFLDINLWVCSVELQSGPGTTLSRASSFASFGPSPSSTRRNSQVAATQSQGPVVHARRHFFALSDWRGASGELRGTLAAAAAGTVRGGRDIAFANGHRLVVVKNGLDYAENVSATERGSGKSGSQNVHDGGTGGSSSGKYVWNVVFGSLHRRATRW